MVKCNKCLRALHDCQNCRGRGGISSFGHWTNCKNCQETGFVCSVHHGFWRSNTGRGPSCGREQSTVAGGPDIAIRVGQGSARLHTSQ